MKQAIQHYYQILEKVVLHSDQVHIEEQLSEAFDLGRQLIDQRVPPDEITNIHHLALIELAQKHPELAFPDIAESLTKPFMEMSMAYGMAFRAQLEKGYQVMLDSRLEHTRMEAVGAMAAGIAHDFNNILGSIVGYTELASDDLPEGSLGKQNLEQVLVAAFRARDIVLRLLAFARQAPTQAVEVELVSQIKELLGLLNVSYRPYLVFDFQSRLSQAKVMADPGQWQQIVMNLCINAADAMEQRGMVQVGLEAASLEGNTGNKPAVCLTVTDRGHGIPADVQKRMFMPFFTTKAPNKGSGLGLSVVYGIVNSLGGEIEVHSQTDSSKCGTQFRITLPCLTPED